METLISVYVFIFGLMIGSFLNVVILRLPVKKDLVFTRSACPHCGTKLKWFHNIPVASFVFLLGKCGFCKSKISWRYPVIELLTGILAVVLLPAEFSLQSWGNYFFLFAIGCIFLCHFVIDWEHQLLLDSLNLYLLAIVLIQVIFTYSWQYWLIGGLFGFCGPLAVTWLFYKIRGKIGLGGGDIKLFGILGILLGPLGVMFNIFLSCMVGALVGGSMIALGKHAKDRPMAFGPAILLVAFFQIYFPQYSRLLQAFLFGWPEAVNP